MRSLQLSEGAPPRRGIRPQPPQSRGNLSPQQQTEDKADEPRGCPLGSRLHRGPARLSSAPGLGEEQKALDAGLARAPANDEGKGGRRARLAPSHLRGAPVCVNWLLLYGDLAKGRDGGKDRGRCQTFKHTSFDRSDFESM